MTSCEHILFNDFLRHLTISPYNNNIDINNENIGNNTEYCFDSNGNDEFKCECNEGFDGKRCDEDVCLLECKNDGNCITAIVSTTGTKQPKCICADNFTGF